MWFSMIDFSNFVKFNKFFLGGKKTEKYYVNARLYERAKAIAIKIQIHNKLKSQNYLISLSFSFPD